MRADSGRQLQHISARIGERGCRFWIARVCESHLAGPRRLGPLYAAVVRLGLQHLDRAAQERPAGDDHRSVHSSIDARREIGRVAGIVDLPFQDPRRELAVAVEFETQPSGSHFRERGCVVAVQRNAQPFRLLDGRELGAVPIEQPARRGVRTPCWSFHQYTSILFVLIGRSHWYCTH